MASKYDKYLKEALEIYNKQRIKSIVKVAAKLHKKYKITTSFPTFRRGLSHQLDLNPVKKITVKQVKKTEAKPFVLSAWNTKTGLMMDIDEYCEFYKLPRKDIKSYKLVSHTGTPFYNILFKENIEFTQDLTEDYIEAVIKKHLQPVKLPIYKGTTSTKALRVIYTDTHIAMETNKNGFGLYGGVWNQEQLFIRKDEIIKDIQKAFELYGYFDEIHIIDLGDFMDGWDALTVRGGHELPQNMDNETAFDVGLAFKIELIKAIVQLNYTSKIKSFNICNDNHSGSFGYTVNAAAKKFLEAMFPSLVQVVNLRKFISHYYYGEHCFVLTHGKDAKSLKFGFKPNIDAKGVEKIKEYISINKLFRSANYVTFEKGDSHQQLFDYASSDEFDYMNYMALSPSSEWVQTNFKRGRSGYNLMVVDKRKKEKIMIAKEFEWMDNNQEKQYKMA